MNCVQLAEISIANNGVKLDMAERVLVTHAFKEGNSPPDEGIQKIIDGSSSTKWLDFNKGSGGLLFSFPNPVAATQFSMTTANDEPGRDPVSWKLEASEDGDNFTLVHEMSNGDQDMPMERQTETKWFQLMTSDDLQDE